MNEPLRDRMTHIADSLDPTEPDLLAIARRGRLRRTRRRASTGLIAVVAAIAVAVPLYGLSGLGPGPSSGAAGTAQAIIFTTSTTPTSPGQIYRMNPDGSGLIRLTTDDADYSSVTVAPDGSQMAFVRFSGRGTQSSHEGIYVSKLDGTGMHQILAVDAPHPIGVVDLEWSPDGSTIGFVKREIASGSEADWPTRLWIMAPDGTDPHVIMDNVVSFAWSPDGSQIVFEDQQVQGTSFVDDLFVTSIDPHVTDLVAHLSTDGRSRQPVWAPSQDAIAYTHGWAPSTSVATLDTHTQATVTLFDAPGMSDPLAWSPSGDRLLIRSVHDQRCELVEANSTGGSTNVVFGSESFYSEAAVDTGPGCVQSAAWASVPTSETQPSPDPATPSPSEGPSPSAPFFPTAPRPASGSDDALLTGTLTIRDGCVLIDQGAQYTLPIWPFGYTNASEGDGLAVRDTTGALVATEGEPVTLGGGYTAEFQPANKVSAKETQVADLERALGYSIPERCLGNDVYGVWAVGGALPSPQLTEDYTNPMGIPITFSYPSDWYAGSISQPAPAGSGLVIGAVISNVPTAIPPQDPSAPSPGPLPSDPNLPSNFVTITILGGTQQTSPALPDTPLPLSMRDAQPVPGVSNIRVLPARLGGMNVEIQVVAGPSASAADIATADAIVASIRMSDS